jgi:polyribonucleotide nucleotidyltransferase
MTVKRFETEISGKKVIVEHGRMAQQAGASVTVQIGGTTILATATMSKGARDGIDFFPLMVDYEERYFAAGRIKGPRFIKREGRPSNEAILTGRMIDRGLRPLFPSDMRNEVQVICLPLSLDYENKPDMIAMLAACLAVHISNIPFDGPIAGVRIGMVNGHFIVNPTADEIEYSDLQLVVMGDSERLCMVDCDAKEVSDDDAKAAFKLAMETMGPIAKFIDDIRKEIGVEKAKKDDLIWRGGPDPEDQKIIGDLKTEAKKHLDKFLFNTPKGSKGERKVIIHELEKKLITDFAPKLKTPDRSEDETREYLEKLIGSFFFDFIEEQVTLAILDSDKRVDGRKLNEIRPLVAEIGVLPRTHGSGLFSRGETQVLSVATLGAPGDEVSIETMESDGTKKYFHHYNFLPYSVGEVKPIRGAGRREIGHGILAEKAIKQIYPEPEDFPYTVRVVTEVLGSNGSSSMAATCGSSLALMDAGVPLKKAVAGIAMGMASDGKRYKILTDIQDMEDGPGGMDFKFTSTKDGITAIQMDTKTRGLSPEIVEKTFVEMRKAINEILSVMGKTIDKPKPELSPYAPRIIYFMIDPEKIGNVIGPGGKVIRAITEEFDVQIDIEDDGTVLITSTDAERAKMAEKQIKELVRVVEVGEIFEEAKVVKIMNFGAFLNLTPGQDGFLHVSNIEWARVEKVTDRINLGDTVRVKVIRIENGKVDVSAKALLPKPEGYVDRRPPRRDSRKGGSWKYKKKDDRKGKKYGKR